MKTNLVYEEKQNNARGYSGNADYIQTDCPNPGDFELVRKNLERAIKMQDRFWKWKKKQEKKTPELHNLHKWRLN